MIDPIFIELAKQAPALSVLVFLVLRFLGHLQEYQCVENARTERMAEALERNTEMLGRASAYLGAQAKGGSP